MFYLGTQTFPQWNGSGFVSGLATKALVRIVFDGHGGAKTAERRDVDRRIRDVEEGPDGSLWMLHDRLPFGGLWTGLAKAVDIRMDQPVKEPDGMRAANGKLLLAENSSGKISVITVNGDKVSVTVIKEGLKTPTAGKQCLFRCRNDRDRMSRSEDSKPSDQHGERAVRRNKVAREAASNRPLPRWLARNGVLVHDDGWPRQTDATNSTVGLPVRTRYRNVPEDPTKIPATDLTSFL
jgi:hypothetical protein